MKNMKFLVFFLFFYQVLSAREGFKGYQQDWGFVEVRPGAHTFWWLHYTLANVTEYTERPLVIWLQGGPGGSSTAIGNFEILGPLDLNLNEREHTWIKNYNVLFIDNPVGTGFSWVENTNLLATNNSQIAHDLVELMRGFYEVLPEFKSVPLHIFGQSYGPKMGVEFAYELDKEIKAGTIECNLTSVGVGNAFISPVDSTLSWSGFLLEMGFVDFDGAQNIKNSTMKVQNSLAIGNYCQATNDFFFAQFKVYREVESIDFYDVLNKQRIFSFRKLNENVDVMIKNLENETFYHAIMMEMNNVKPESAASLNRVMAMVHEALQLPENVKWDYFNVLSPLYEDFMKPVEEIVEKLLDETEVQVVVFSGNSDLICATPGTVAWLNRLNWHGKEDFAKTKRRAFSVNNVLEGYQRRFKNLNMYWILQAGHSVNVGNPNGMSFVLKETMG